MRFRHICVITAWIALATVVASAPSRADDGPVEPYVLYIASEGEFARCGPSEDYYKTDALRAGSEVEVYLETEDGWLGIRPPASSFCWIQSDQIEATDDEATGIVADGSAVAWIGTQLGKARQYRWQVRLQQGEEVTIIGTARRDGPDGEEVWYRIVPPPGEFRWVHRSQTTDELEKVVYNQPRPTPQLETRPSATRLSAAVEEEPESVLDDEPIGSGVAIQEQAADTTIAALPSPRREPEPLTSDLAIDLGTGDEWTAGARNRGSLGERSPLRATDPPALARVTPASFESPTPSGYAPNVEIAGADVEALRLELSRAMAAGALAAEVEPLRGRCATLSGEGTDSVTRGRASLLLRRIDEYQRIARQRDGQAAAPTVADGTGSPAAGMALAVGDSVAVAEATGQATRFDRQGLLVKVYSTRPNAPPYVLTDSAGRTLSYVTPAPGINLRRYLNQEIGLYGRVAYDTSLETPHLIAEQAVRIRR